MRQAATTNYLRHLRDEQRLARTDPRLPSLARWSRLTLALHLLLVAITILYIQTGFDDPFSSQVCAVLLLSAFVLDTSRPQDGMASTLHAIVQGFLAGIAFAIAMVLPELAARTLQTIGGDDAAPLACLAGLARLPLCSALGATIGGVGAAVFSRIRHMVDDRWHPMLTGGTIGALISAGYDLEAHSPAWAGGRCLRASARSWRPGSTPSARTGDASAGAHAQRPGPPRRPVACSWSCPSPRFSGSGSPCSRPHYRC
jgi:hypothetical protein